MDDTSAPLELPGSEEEQIYCCDVSGNLIAVPRSQVSFSPAAYGILIENHRVLLQVEPKSTLYHPPGGRIAAEQTTAQALRQTFPRSHWSHTGRSGNCSWCKMNTG